MSFLFIKIFLTVAFIACTGSILEKQGKDLSALGELMSSLVQSQLEYAEGLRKTAKDGTNNTQEFFEQFLATSRTQTDTQVSGLQLFLAENFLPKFQTVAKALQEQGQAVQQLQRAMTVCFISFVPIVGCQILRWKFAITGGIAATGRLG